MKATLERIVLRACRTRKITDDDCHALRVTIARMCAGKYATVRGGLHGWHR